MKSKLVKGMMSFVVCTAGIGYSFLNVGVAKADQSETPLPQYVTDLGVQIRNVRVLTGDVGKDASGKDVLYTVLTANGAPAQFEEVDVNTGQTLKQFDLPNVQGAWAVLQASDARVYIGGYNSPYLYRYDPATDKLENLGEPPGVSNMIYEMSEAKNGDIYGGSYAPGHLWQYDPSTSKFTDLGIPLSGADYVESTTYNPDENKIYAGTGALAGIVAYDLNNPNYATDPASRQEILPSQFQHGGSDDIQFAYDLNYVGGKLFVHDKDTLYKGLVLNPDTGAAISAKNADTGTSGVDIPMTSLGVSPKSPLANVVYFSYYGTLYSYDLDTDTYGMVKDKNGNPINIGGSALDFSYVKLNDPNFPGYSLVGLENNSGGFYEYNLETGNVKVETLNLIGQPVTINNIITGPDGKVYTNGYLSGGVSAYTPSTGTSAHVNGIGQAEGVSVLGNDIYFGVYPGAKIVDYPVGGQAYTPFSLGDATNGYQDRPFAVLGVNDINKVFVGTCPTYGKVGGAFVVYDPVTKTTKVYTDVLNNSLSPGQSFVSLAYKDGKVYIGTSIAGGLNSTPTTTEGKFIVWDYATAKTVYETVPVPGAGAVQGLIVGPDGNIWGMAGGNLFIFDPQTQSIIYNEHLMPEGSDWRNAFLTSGTDGTVYGTADGEMFKIDAATKQMTTIIPNGVFGLAQDDWGNVYTRSGADLLKYSDPNLVLKPVGADIQVSGTTIKRTQSATIRVPDVLLEKGRTTRDLSGATIQYMTDNPNVVSVSNGVITGLKVGNADVWAQVTVNGVTVDSKKVTITVQELPLSSVSIAAKPTTLQRDQSVTLNVYGVCTDGAAADLKGAQIDYTSSDPTVVSVVYGVAAAHNTGTANVSASVTLNGQTLQTPPVTITVTTSIDSVRRLLAEYEKSGDLSGPLVPQLTNSLDQADDQLSKGHSDQAVDHMNDFIKHLNDPAMQSNMSQVAKDALNSDAQALIDSWK